MVSRKTFHNCVLFLWCLIFCSLPFTNASSSRCCYACSISQKCCFCMKATAPSLGLFKPFQSHRALTHWLCEGHTVHHLYNRACLVCKVLDVGGFDSLMDVQDNAHPLCDHVVPKSDREGLTLLKWLILWKQLFYCCSLAPSSVPPPETQLDIYFSYFCFL